MRFNKLLFMVLVIGLGIGFFSTYAVIGIVKHDAVQASQTQQVAKQEKQEKKRIVHKDKVFIVEDCPNPDYLIFHVKYKISEDLIDEYNMKKNPLGVMLCAIPGVTRVSAEKYTIYILKDPIFDWEKDGIQGRVLDALVDYIDKNPKPLQRELKPQQPLSSSPWD